MAFFLRDELVTNVTIDEEALIQISQAFETRRPTMPLAQLPADGLPDQVHLTYIIRFDNKGYRVFSLPDLLHHFRQADYVERVFFTLESSQSLRTNRIVGSLMELRLERHDPGRTAFLTATADAADWVDASFSAVREVLGRHKNRNGWIRGAWTDLIIQVIGVFVGFVVSLWFASKIAPKLTIDNAFLISFFLVLLVFSNLWTFINQRLRALVNMAFPNVSFYRPNRDGGHWLIQGLIVGIAGAVTLYLIGLLLSYVGQVLGTFVN